MNLYESNKTIFIYKKERARVSLLEGTKQIFQRILGGSKVLILFGRKCCLLQNSEKVSGNLHQIQWNVI